MRSALILEHLAKITGSARFAQSRRLCAFLELVVQAAIQPEPESLKESVIAVEVYQRTADFDAKSDSIVRTEASRLRKKLDEYYANEGVDDPVRFSLPKGAYALEVEFRDEPAPIVPPADHAVAEVRPPQRRLILWTLPIALGLLAFAVVLYRAAQRPRVYDTFQVTSLPGRQLQPSLSPDGSRVAFTWDGEQGDNFDIYVKPLRGGGIVRLTSHPMPDRSPAWSPDGASVAFLRELSGNRQAVYIAPAAGGSERLVTEIDTVVAGIAWTPDSAQLVVPDAVAGQGLALFLVSAVNGERRRLTEPRNSFHPALSPDGRTLAFGSDDRRPDGVSSLNLLPLDAQLRPAGAVIPLPETAGPRTWQPAWSRDGRSLLYSTFDNVRWRAFRVTTATHRVEPLDSIGGGVNYAQEIPGGGLLFAREANHFLIARVSPESGGRPVTAPAFPTVEDDFGPALSPDGRRLAFISNRGGALGVWLADPDGSNAQPVTGAGVQPARPRWSPDSKWVVFRAIFDGRSAIYRVSANDRRAERLPLNASTNNNPSVSRDGRWLYFTSTIDGAPRICRAPFQGSGPVETVIAEDALAAEESMDGRYLYYWTRAGIHRLALPAGTSELVLPGAPTANFEISSTGIFYENISGGEVTSIRFRPFDSRSPETVYRTDLPIQGWCLVPGQPHLLVGLRRLQSNIEAYVPRRN